MDTTSPSLPETLQTLPPRLRAELLRHLHCTDEVRAEERERLRPDPVMAAWVELLDELVVFRKVGPQDPKTDQRITLDRASLRGDRYVWFTRHNHLDVGRWYAHVSRTEFCRAYTSRSVPVSIPWCAWGESPPGPSDPDLLSPNPDETHEPRSLRSFQCAFSIQTRVGARDSE